MSNQEKWEEQQKTHIVFDIGPRLNDLLRLAVGLLTLLFIYKVVVK